MNYRNKIVESRSLKDKFRFPYPEGCVKWSNETIEHFTVKSQVFYYLKKQGFKVWTEVVSSDNTIRADILAIKNQHGYIVEILKSESDKRFNQKLTGLYGDFVVVKVMCKDFDFSKFCL